MGARTSVLPDLLSQASPATPPRHDRSTSEEVRTIFITIVNSILIHFQNEQDEKIRKSIYYFFLYYYLLKSG